MHDSTQPKWAQLCYLKERGGKKQKHIARSVTRDTRFSQQCCSNILGYYIMFTCKIILTFWSISTFTFRVKQAKSLFLDCPTVKVLTIQWHATKLWMLWSVLKLLNAGMGKHSVLDVEEEELVSVHAILFNVSWFSLHEFTMRKINWINFVWNISQVYIIPWIGKLM